MTEARRSLTRPPALRSLDRRGFLQSLAAGTAAAALPARQTAAADHPSGQERVRLAVMGVNGRGRALAAEFAARADSEVVVVCDVDELAAGRCREAVAEVQASPPRLERDFRRALDDATIDALVIAAPDHWHAPATILALAAGKHVYVEKPACHNPQEGEWMVAAARRAGRVVQVGTQRRSAPAIIEAIGRVQAGELGPVRFARGWINSTRPSIGRGREAAVPSHLDYELWQGPAPRTPYRDNLVHYHWHWFWNWGTGELGNNGIHMLDLCRWGLGVTYPTSVVSSGGKLFFDDDQETPDTQLATFHFGDKAIAWEHRTWHRRGFEDQSHGATFYGDKGALVIGSGDYAVYDMDGRRLDRVATSVGGKEHLDDFLAAIRSGGRPRADVEIGVASTLLCHLGNIALRTGRTVQCDPADGHVLGDPDQQALWRRSYAPGWEPQVG